jgi:hypothetical protein
MTQSIEPGAIVSRYNVERVLLSHLPSEQLVFKEETKERGLISRKDLIDGEELLEGVTNHFEA